MIFAFDECTSPMDPYDYQKQAMDRTHRWALRSLTRHNELDTDKKEVVNRFVDTLDKFLMAVSWGGYESLKMPTLAFYDFPGQPDPPLPFQLVRLYAGLEDEDYLLTNLDKALKVV